MDCGIVVAEHHVRIKAGHIPALGEPCDEALIPPAAQQQNVN